MATPERTARVWLFHLKRLQGQKGKLSPNVIREICEYIADPQLIDVHSTFLRYFHFHTSTWGPKVPLTTPIQADQMSRWVVLEGRVFCCGGVGRATACMLARDGAVEKTADMIERRGQ